MTLTVRVALLVVLVSKGYRVSKAAPATKVGLASAQWLTRTAFSQEGLLASQDQRVNLDAEVTKSVTVTEMSEIRDCLDLPL